MPRLFLVTLPMLFLGTFANSSHADQALATARNCMGCHHLEKKVVGPAYKDIAARYRGDKAAAEKLAAKIVKGGTGTWGAAVMPANSQVNDADARKLASWILSLK